MLKEFVFGVGRASAGGLCRARGAMEVWKAAGWEFLPGDADSSGFGAVWGPGRGIRPEIDQIANRRC